MSSNNKIENGNDNSMKLTAFDICRLVFGFCITMLLVLGNMTINIQISSIIYNHFYMMSLFFNVIILL